MTTALHRAAVQLRNHVDQRYVQEHAGDQGA